MSKKLHSLLIGINNYPSPNQLSGCLSDVSKVKEYLTSLDTSAYNKIENPSILVNDEATKDNIVSTLKTTISKLDEDDTLVIYFSGHGAEEVSEGRFVEDHNGLLQGLVCYHKTGDEDNYLLADKEIRYLLNQSKVKAHIVAIFDSCHSGDITRSTAIDKKIKRMAVKHPQRPFEQFIFSEEFNEEEFKTKGFDKVFPDSNAVVISACQSNQSAWEGAIGGIFTHQLIETLKATNNIINYSGLVRSIENSIRLTTMERQTPTITIHGDREFNQLTSWLRLNGDLLKNGASYIQFNKKIGWIYNKGKLEGLKPDDVLKINLPDVGVKSIRVNQVNLIDSTIHDPVMEGIELDNSLTYPVIANKSMIKPLVSINNLDNDSRTTEMLASLLSQDERVEFSENLSNCDYQFTIFNELIYVAFPNKSFQPLNQQFNLLSEEFEDTSEDKAFGEYVDDSIRVLSKWYHYKELNFDDGFIKIPIKVEVQLGGSNLTTDITNGSIQIKPKQRHPTKKQLYNTYSINVTNDTDETIYVTVLALITSKHEISDYPFDRRTILLNPGASKSFDNAISLDPYQEIYNWDKESVIFKFIVNNYSEITTEIPSMTQEGFLEPLTHLDLMGTSRGGGSFNEFEAPEKNAVYTSVISMENTELNIISGELLPNWEWYQQNELLAPFIERLYFDIDPTKLINEVNIKYGSREVKSKGGFKMTLGNIIDYTRRNRRFRRLRKRYPNKRVIVAEGDSWFLYPILVKDTIDYLMDDWPVKSLAWAGDTLANYKKSGDLLKAVIKYEPKHVLISGGGNDIIGSEIQNLLKDNVQNAKEPTDYLNGNFAPQIKKLGEYYIYFFKELSAHPYVEKIIVHGYDYIRADHAKIVTKGGWLNKYLEKKGIHDYLERERLIRYLIDTFNNELQRVVNTFPKAKYLDMRGIVDKDEWFDEIHPNDIGYKKVADKFISEIQ